MTARLGGSGSEGGEREGRRERGEREGRGAHFAPPEFNSRVLSIL
jgi:hypothetical protein